MKRNHVVWGLGLGGEREGEMGCEVRVDGEFGGRRREGEEEKDMKKGGRNGKREERNRKREEMKGVKGRRGE